MKFVPDPIKTLTKVYFTNFVINSIPVNSKRVDGW